MFIRRHSAHDSLRDQYARVRQAQADALFDEIMDTADTPVTGVKTKLDKNDQIIETSKADMTENRRMQIGARKWVAAKHRPKVCGDKLDVDLTRTLDFVVSAKPMTERC